MPVELRNTQRRVKLDLRRLRRDAQHLLAAVGREDQTLSVLIADDREMGRLHERWMNLPGATDVLSFAARGDTDLGMPGSAASGARAGMVRVLRIRAAAPPPLILGDIAISAETAARRRPADPQRETLRCLTHGLLHLIGLDHRTRAQRLRMNRRARALVRRVGH